MRGREAEAARNDESIVAAAREVLLEDADAPMTAVARRAGVGVASLYRRYPSRHALVVAVCVEAMAASAAAADRAPDVASFLGAALDGAGGTLKALGIVEPTTPELEAAKETLHAAVDRLVRRSKRAGTLRRDASAADLSLVLEQVAALRVGDERRTREIRRRALDLSLAGLRPTDAKLSGRAPTWAELTRQRS